MGCPCQENWTLVFKSTNLRKASLAFRSPLSNRPLAQQQKTSPLHSQRKKVGHPLESWTLFYDIITRIIKPVDLTELIVTKLDWCLPEKHLFLIFLFRTPWFHWYQLLISHFYRGVLWFSSYNQQSLSQFSSPHWLPPDATCKKGSNCVKSFKGSGCQINRLIRTRALNVNSELKWFKNRGTLMPQWFS